MNADNREGECMRLQDRVIRSGTAALFFVFGLVLFCGPVFAVTTDVDLYVKIESFEWKEYSTGGSQLMKESGPIYTLGASTKVNFANSLTCKGRGELFFGNIDYDGQTWGGTPVETDTDYSGFRIETDVGKIFMISDRSSLEPFVGFGWKSWLRDLQSTETAAGYAVGYEETWSIVYARLGMRGDHVFSKQLKLFAEAGFNLPVYNENVVDLNGLSVTIEPGKEVSLFAEAGITWKNLKTSIFYEGVRFSKSDLEFIESGGDTYGIYQPESEADMFGISIGIAF
nr:autotransporter domain-containing protein [Syntrophales bacterium]